MRFHPEARQSHYDVIVVGSGIGGLSCAALLAKAGLHTLVVERHDRVGGYAHAFRRGLRVFDSAVHMVGREPLAGLLETLEIGDACRLRAVDPVYSVVYPELRMRVPAGLEAFLDAHLAHFPDEEKGLRSLLQECLDIRNEAAHAARRPLLEVARRPGRYPCLLRHRRSTLEQVLEAHLSNAKLRSLLGSLWPYLGLPPAKVSFLYWASMLLSYVEAGAVTCEGSFQELARALASALEARGGEVLLRSPVRRIRVEGAAAAGVVLENGQSITAPRVVSNADAAQTVLELVGAEHFPARYVKSLRAMRPSVSAFVVYAAARLEPGAFGLGVENFFYPSFDHDAAFAAVERGEPTWLSVTVPTLADPGLAPADEQLLVLTSLVRSASRRSWKADKERTRDRLLGLAESWLPGLRESLLFDEAGTPRTMERYTRNTEGALYGFDLAPDQVGPARPDQTTPLEGLFLAGHWTRPGGGIAGVVTSGMQAAEKILRAASIPPLA